MSSTAPGGPPNHDGTPRHPDDVLLGSVTALGLVLSATTTVTRSGRLRYSRAGARKFEVLTAMRSAIFWLGCGALIGFGAVIALEALHRHAAPEILVYGTALGALVGGARAWRSMAAVAMTTYVCEGGLARITRKGGVPSTELLAFSSVARARRMDGQQQVYKGYEGTHIASVWDDAHGKVLFEIGGLYDARSPVPTENDQHFANAAHAAWERRSSSAA